MTTKTRRSRPCQGFSPSHRRAEQLVEHLIAAGGSDPQTTTDLIDHLGWFEGDRDSEKATRRAFNRFRDARLHIHKCRLLGNFHLSKRGHQRDVPLMLLDADGLIVGKDTVAERTEGQLLVLAEEDATFETQRLDRVARWTGFASEVEARGEWNSAEVAAAARQFAADIDATGQVHPASRILLRRARAGTA